LPGPSGRSVCAPTMHQPLRHANSRLVTPDDSPPQTSAQRPCPHTPPPEDTARPGRLCHVGPGFALRPYSSRAPRHYATAGTSHSPTAMPPACPPAAGWRRGPWSPVVSAILCTQLYDGRLQGSGGAGAMRGFLLPPCLAGEGGGDEGCGQCKGWEHFPAKPACVKPLVIRPATRRRGMEACGGGASQ
jgi:hypothetical protein